jgi:L-ascorbate metabolism protein UlaG (beta-lactamase superfamily)
MEIKYLGHASFLIKTKTAKVVTDPYDPSIGLKFPKVEAEIITISHQHFDHNRANLVLGNGIIFDMPGEYERLGVKISGFSFYHDKNKGKERGENILFKIESEGISLLHCGDLGDVPDDNFLEAVGDIDILLVPVGGFYTIGPDEALELIKKIEPSIVIPMHFNHPKLKQESFGKLFSLDDFLKKAGAQNEAPIPKLSIKKEELRDEMKVVVLSF